MSSSKGKGKGRKRASEGEGDRSAEADYSAGLSVTDFTDRGNMHHSLVRRDESVMRT